MNRKITFFAFAAKWGFRGASGSSAAGAVRASEPSKWAREMAPSPTPHCCKNHRRATRRGSATGKAGCARFITSLQSLGRREKSVTTKHTKDTKRREEGLV